MVSLTDGAEIPNPICLIFPIFDETKLAEYHISTEGMNDPGLSFAKHTLVYI